MLDEFKKFAMRGNVVDLAVGVIIGAAFGAIVSSLVGDIIMPIIGSVTGGLDFSNYFTAVIVESDGNGFGGREKAGRRAGLGQFPHARHQLLDHRLGAVSVHQGHQPAEPRGTAASAGWTFKRSAVADRDPRPAQEPLRFWTAYGDQA